MLIRQADRDSRIFKDEILALTESQRASEAVLKMYTYDFTLRMII